MKPEPNGIRVLIPAPVGMACIIVASSVKERRPTGEDPFVDGFYAGRRSAALQILKTGITPQNRKVVGQCLRDQLAWK